MKQTVFTLILLGVFATPVFSQNTFSFALNLADPNITTYKGPCYAHLEDGFKRDELVLLLPGKGYQPTFYDQIMIQAGKLGYHSLALKYVDDAPLDIQASCGGNGSSCFVDAREEGITGNDVSPFVSIDRTNSIEHRLIEAVQYLNDVFPGNGWDKFWTGDSTISWDKVRIIGHDEGAGYAAAIALRERLARVVLMGWADWDDNANTVPAWLSTPGVTDAANWYGFAHVQDEVAAFSRQEATWDSLGMKAFGAIADVDAQAFPFNNSHILSTDVMPNLQNNAYNDAVIVSSFVPQNNGEPVFLEVWSYLIDGSTKVSIDDQVEELSVRIYPNPATSVLYVEGNFGLNTSVTLYNQLGQIAEADLTISADLIEIHPPAAAVGMYLLKVDSDTKSVIRQVIIQ